MGWKVLLWVAIVFAGIRASADETVKIGEVNPITGAIGRYGTTCHQGIVLAIDEANSSGGVLGQKIALVTEDNQSQAGQPSIWEIFSGPMLKTTVLASLAATGCQGGYYAITFWVPRFLTTERKLSIVSSTGYLSALIIGSFIG